MATLAATIRLTGRLEKKTIPVMNPYSGIMMNKKMGQCLTIALLALGRCLTLALLALFVSLGSSLQIIAKQDKSPY